jgi:hypothetical protein
MSVVVWDGKTLAADRQGDSGGTAFTIKKLFKLKGGEIVAFVGAYCNGLMVLEWYEAGAKKEEWPDCQKTDDWVTFIVASDKECFYYQRSPTPISVMDKFRAWGSGEDIALGAMEMGANAIKAVAVASKYDSLCGRGCDSEEAIGVKKYPKKYDLSKLTINAMKIGGY